MKINPKNFYQRELDILPPHFTNTVVRTTEPNIEKIRQWIYENCRGRYSITNDVVIRNNQPRPITVLGFEEPGDLILFALSGLAQNSEK